MTHLLGLTGSIGMGKSTTADMFRDEGVPVWDADATVHHLYQKGGDAVAAIGHAFPGAIVDGGISRDGLKKVIATDPDALSKIENIVHPLVAVSRLRFIEAHDDPLIVFDIPLLYETGADKWLNSVLVVSAPPDTQQQRVMARPGMTDDQLQVILSRQIPDAEKRKRADHVIETLTLDGTRTAVQKLIAKIKGQIDA